jgi:hypothetical protein
MKRIFLVFLLGLIIISCEKEQFLQDTDIPLWLRDKIAHDEEIIRTNSQSGLDIAAWIRYEYDGNYYFEYLNLLSSAGPSTYDNDGNLVSFNLASYQTYFTKRCCKKYIWRGPSYFENQ